MDVDVLELAKVVTEKIRDEIAALKLIGFGEVVSVTTGANSSYRATVKVAGSSASTVPLDVLGDYVPAAGHWVLLVYPPGQGRERPLPIILGRFKRVT